MNTLEEDIFTLIYDIYIFVIEKKNASLIKYSLYWSYATFPKNGKRADSFPYQKIHLKRNQNTVQDLWNVVFMIISE